MPSVQELPLDVPTLIKEALSEGADAYKALSVVLSHARGITGSGGGAALRLGDDGRLEVVVTQGRASPVALSAFQPDQGRLATVWSADEPTAAVAMLGDADGFHRLALAYATVPLRAAPKVVLVLMSSVPAYVSASEALPRREVERVRELARLAAPLLEHVEEHARLRHELVELKRRVQDAKAAVRARDAFLGRMSHDLRTPLGAIMGFAQLLEMEPLGQAPREHVQYILQAVRRLHRHLTQAIEIAYAAAGKLTLELQPVDVVAVLDDCLSLVSTDAAEAGVRVAIAPPPRAGGSPIVVSTDVQRLSQVVLNLLSNAIRVSSRGQTVTVSVTPGERTVSIEVADRGPGIPPHLLPRLFIPYAAGPDGDSDTALGLPLSHSLTTALGGTLTVDSEVGKGTRFTVTLPRR